MRVRIKDRSAEELIIFLMCLLSLCVLLPFSLIRFIQGDYIVASVEALGVLANATFLAHVYRTGKTVAAGVILAIIMFLGISIIIILQGPASLHFLYPAIVASFIIIRPHIALAFCLASSAVVAVQITPQISLSETIIFILASSICIFFSYASAVIRSKQRDKLFELSSRDGLTGCGNRRAMDESIEAAIRLHQRNNIDVSLLIIDLDNFKQVNDHRGHAVGDQILRNVSAVVLSRIRTTDSIFRYGGDEFVVLLPNSNLERSIELAEKLRALVEEQGQNNQTSVSISLGVAQYQQGQSAIQWLSNADSMLLQAKREGKNKVLFNRL
jgi:diguanylate cyclase (GGDEF)-like protein